MFVKQKIKRTTTGSPDELSVNNKIHHRTTKEDRSWRVDYILLKMSQEFVIFPNKACLLPLYHCLFICRGSIATEISTVICFSWHSTLRCVYGPLPPKLVPKPVQKFEPKIQNIKRKLTYDKLNITFCQEQQSILKYLNTVRLGCLWNYEIL